MVRLQRIYAHLAGQQIITPITQAVTEISPKPAETDFLESFEKSIEIKGLDYIITKKIEINKDLVFPIGNYHIKQECGIIAKDCKITIQPGTNFYFDDCAFFSQAGGRFIAVGHDGNKIQFLPEEEDVSINMHMGLADLESQMEYCVISHFKISSSENRYPWAPFIAQFCKSHMKSCEFSQNKGSLTGGGIYVREGEATFDSCKISRNIVSIFGGGVYAEKTKIKFKETEINNNHGTNEHEIFGGGVHGTESVLEFDDCRITGNTARCGAGIQLNNGCKAELKKTKIKNNLANGIATIGGASEIYLDDECILEGNGRPQLNGGLKNNEFKYNPCIIKENEKPGANNLPVLLNEISNTFGYKIKEDDIHRILSKIQKKYNLEEPEIDTLKYRLRENIEEIRRMDQILKDTAPAPYKPGIKFP